MKCMLSLVLLLAMCGPILSIVEALQSVPSFTLNLDLPPMQRWNGAVKTIVDLHGWQNSFGPVLDLYLPIFDLLLPKTTQQQLASKVNSTNPQFYLEALGIMKQLQTHGCSLCNDSSLMFSFAYYYELAHAVEFKTHLPKTLRRSCCGILSLPVNRSKAVIHGRNMDESPHQGRNMTLNIRVMKGGKHVYNIVDWTWIIGAATTSSMTSGVTLEMNWNNDGPVTSMTQIVQRLLDPKTQGVLQVFRTINEQGMHFDQAVQFIMTSQFAAPFYNIISGTGRRGAVLTIEFDSNKNVAQFLNDSSPVSFMVQTNYDRWLPDQGTMRRTTAEDALQMMGRERSGSELGVWMALSTYPVHNQDTMFSALLSVEKDPELYVRRAMSPVRYG